MSVRSGLCAGSVLVLLLSAACSKEKLNELVDKTKEQVSAGAAKVKESVSSATDTAKEQLALSGSARVQLDSELTTSGCYAEFLTLGGGRPNVLQIRSYKTPDQESFPSLYFRATTTAAGGSELVGQTLSGELFLQKESGGSVWTSPGGGHVDVKILAVDQQKIDAEIVGGSLVSIQQPAEIPAKGGLNAVWK